MRKLGEILCVAQHGGMRSLGFDGAKRRRGVTRESRSDGADGDTKPAGLTSLMLVGSTG